MFYTRLFNRTAKPSPNQSTPADYQFPVQFFLIDKQEKRDSLPNQQEQTVYRYLAAVGHSESLSLQETRHYIERELRAQNWKNCPAFDSPVFYVIHQLSGGVPKRICTICNRLLLQCFIEQRQRITVIHAQAIGNELSQKPSIALEAQRKDEGLIASPPREDFSIAKPAGTKQTSNRYPPGELLRPQTPQPLATPRDSEGKARFACLSLSKKKGARRGTW